LFSSASFFTIAAIESRTVYPETSALLLYFIASVVIAILAEEYPFSFGSRAYRFITLRAYLFCINVI
jgi:hypothetical protein